MATYDIQTKSGSGFNERKPNGTIHYVEAQTAQKTQFNFFGPLIIGDEDQELMSRFNEDSWTIRYGYVESALEGIEPQEKYQLMRNGYFSVDTESKKGNLILNEIVPLKSSYK